MKKSELIDRVRKESGAELSKGDTAAVLDAAFGVIGERLRDEKRFAWPGFGTFVVKDRAARKGRNPRTGEDLQIAASRTVAFKPAAVLQQGL